MAVGFARETLSKDKQEQLLRAILRELRQWRLCPRDDDMGGRWLDARHDSADGRALHFTFDGYRNEGRLSICPTWPRDSQRHQFRAEIDSITVDYSRPVEKIAADIQRRLIVPYEAAYAEQLAKMQESNAKRERQLAFAGELAKIAGTDHRHYQSKEPQSTFWVPGGVNGIDQIDVHSDCTAQIKLSYSLPEDVTRDLVRFLVDRMKRHRQENPSDGE